MYDIEDLRQLLKDMLGDIASSTMRVIADLVTTLRRSLELVEPEVLLQQNFP